jgi:hypothetical protein
MNNNQDNLSFLDFLTVFSVFLQIMGYEQDQKQTSNDVLFEELQRQDSEYLEKIIKTQEEILQTLSDIKSDFAHRG